MTIIGSAYVDIRAITDHLEEDIKKALAILPDKIDVRVDADTKAAEDQIDLLIAWADLHKIDVPVHANTVAAEAEIAAAAHSADATVNVDADVALARAHIDEFIHEEDTHHIDVPVDVDDAVARGKLASMFESVKKFSENNKPIRLFDSEAIKAAEAEAKRLGEDFKAPFMFRISTQASEAALGHLKTSASNVGEFLNKLGGATQLLEFAQAAIMAKINLGEHAITMGIAAEKAAAMGSAMLSAAGNLLSLGSSAVQLTGLFAALPGVFVGLEIAMKLTTNAFGMMKKAVPDLYKEIQKLKEGLAQDFWSTARTGLEDLLIRSHTLGDQLKETSKIVGSFWGTMFEGMSKGSFAKAMVGDFANLDSGIKIITASSSTFLHIFQTLGEFGSAYIPKLADSFTGLAERFDKFLTKANSDGTLKRWVDQGVEAFHGLVSAVVNTANVIGGLMKAATDAGGASLGIFGAAMERLAAVIKTPEVQHNLVNIFSGANAAIDAIVKGLGVFLGAIGYLSPALKVVETDAGRAIQNILQIFAGILSNPAVFKGIQDMFTGIVNGINAFYTTVGPIGDKLGVIFTIVGMIADSLGHVFANAITVLLPIVKNLLVGIEPLIKPMGDITTAIVNALAPALKILVDTAFPPLITLMTGSVLPALHSLIPVLGTMLPPLVAAFSDMIKRLAPIIGDLIPKLVPLVEALIKIGSAALPPIMAVLPAIVDGFSKFYTAAIAPLIGPITSLITGFLNMKGSGEILAAGIAGIALAIGTFNVGLGLAKGLIAGVKIAQEAYTATNLAATWILRAFGAEVEGLTVKQKLAAIATGIWSGVQTVFNLIMDANPIMMTVLAIGALIAVIILVVQHWGEITKAVTDFVNSTGSMLNDFNKNTQGMFNDFFKNTGGMFTDFFNSTVGMFVDFFKNTIGMFSDFGGKVSKAVGDAWNGITKVIGDVITNVISFVQAHWGLILSFIIGPMGLVIQWIVEHWGQITKVFSDVWKNITDGVSNALKFIGDIITNVTNFITGVWNTFWNSNIGGLVKAVLNLIKVSIEFVFAWMGVFIRTYLAVITTIWNQTWTNVGNFFRDTWNNIVSFVTTVLNVVHAYIAARIAQTQAVWALVWTNVSNFFKTIWNNIVSFVTTVLNVIHAYIAARIAQTQAVWALVWTNVSNFFKTIWNNIVSFVTTVLNVIHAYIAARIAQTQAVWALVWTTISNFFKTVWNGIVNFVTPIIQTIHDTITNAINTVSNTVNTVLNNIAGFFTDTWNNVSTGVSNVFNGIVTTVKNQIDNVMSFVSGIKDRVVGFFSGAGTWLLDSGKSIIQGLIDGINNMISNITNAINDVAKVITDHMPHSPAKRGPLSGEGYTLTSGKALVRDLAGGMVSQIGDVERAAGSLAMAARPKLSANANIFAGMNSSTDPSQGFNGFGQGSLLSSGGSVISPTVNVYPSAPLNETQVGQMAARQLYWEFTNRY